MRYIISDIHGCYEEFMQLLEKINFSKEDELYILGDTVDKGPEPIKVMQELIKRENVFYIIGNHDYIMYKVMKKMAVEITEENVESHLTKEDIKDYMVWISDGGDVTSSQFTSLSRSEQRDILEYIEESEVFEEIYHKDKRFVLVHAGINDFNEDFDMDEYQLKDLLFYRADYSKRYFSDENTFLVTGHTPTIKIRDDKKPLIYKENGHIAIDCGCVYGGNLAAYCIETGQEFYVKREADK
ncbi:MAG: metallophosphoesterase [Eubacterium sp.]|nr:metallophosphoesterase [Eubacterium sp.]